MSTGTINSETSRELWRQNAPIWNLVSERYDIFREHVTKPAFLRALPNVRGKSGLDVCCGNGLVAREIAKLSGHVTGVDITQEFIDKAKAEESANPVGVEYMVGDATHLPFADEAFDFATCTMGLIDVLPYEETMREVHRVIKVGGFFQFSITHPCFMDSDFNVDQLDWILDTNGQKIGKVCRTSDGGNRPEIVEWMLDSAEAVAEGKTFRTLMIHRTMSDWINAIADAGFLLERSYEPKATKEQIEQCPKLQGSEIVPLFQIFRCRKI